MRWSTQPKRPRPGAGKPHFLGRQFFLEKVGGRYQGAVFRFMAGLESGVVSLKFGPDGHLYMAGLGGPHTDWRWKETFTGLQRIRRKSNPPNVFEMLAIRNLGPQTFEIEFTEALAPAALQASNWSIKSWTYKPTKDYYGGKQDNRNHTPTKMNLSPDGKRLTLEIESLSLPRVIAFKANFNSAGGRSLYQGEGWYTLNAYGPGQDPPTSKIVADHRARHKISHRMFSASPRSGDSRSGESRNMLGQAGR